VADPISVIGPIALRPTTDPCLYVGTDADLRSSGVSIPGGAETPVYRARSRPARPSAPVRQGRAIAVALEAGQRLKIAAKCRDPEEIEYFREFVEPYLDDQIEYVGEVTKGEMVELLLGVRVSLFRI
jgi:hypothetical protein